VGNPDRAEFSLPAVGDPASTEIGVILLGLDAATLLAGLGVAALAEDATAVTLLIDQIRHGGEARLLQQHLVAAGLHRWHAERAAHPGHRAWPAAPLRRAWDLAYQAVTERGTCAQATAAYLTACWLRCAEIDRYAASRTGSGSGDRP
jgi:Family of unknown function (DUF6187)